MYRPPFACVPTSSTGHAPPADDSLSKEEVLQGAGLAGRKESGHQLFLPLHAFVVRQGGGCPHCLHTRNGCYCSTGRLPYFLHHLLKQSIHVGHRRTLEIAYTPGF